MQLIVLAAGLGRRFGGDKQVTGVGPRGEWLLDYALYDACQAGFTEAILVVRPDMRWPASRSFPMPVRLAFQEAYGESWGRRKPWGTAHALWSAKDLVEGPFAVVNADDYYGKNTYEQIAEFLREKCTPDHFALPGFELEKTLSPHGPVSRAICRVDEQGLLEEIEEWKRLEFGPKGPGMIREDGSFRPAPAGALVSMNCWAMHDSVFDFLAVEAPAFLKSHTGDLTSEYLLPDMIRAIMKRQGVRVSLLPSSSSWLGITYSADLEPVREAFAEWTRQGGYPSPLPGQSLPRAVLQHFFPTSTLLTSKVISTGHIHQTIYSRLALDGKEEEMVFQQLNPDIFPQPDLLLENALQIGRHLENCEYPLTVVSPLPAPDGSWWAKDSEGKDWRVFPFVKNSFCRVRPESVEDVRKAAEAFGRLHRCLKDVDPSRIRPAISGFFDLAYRWRQWEEALQQAVPDRKKAAGTEIEQVQAGRTFVSEFTLLKAGNALPERLLHGDPKLSNLLFDKDTGDVKAIVDWDTAQPGWIIFEFGDMVRSYTNPRTEEGELSNGKIPFSHSELFDATLKGFLKYTDDWLAPVERAHLKTGARWVVWMQALRFLADYLAGDKYYRVTAPDQNLKRARSQLALLEWL